MRRPALQGPALTVMSPVETQDTTEGAGGGRPQKTLVERLLSPIADVRHDEAASALLMALLMFLIMAAYYLLKTARAK